MDSMDCSDPLIHGAPRLHPGKPAHRLRRCEANVPELRADGFGAKWDDFMGFPPFFSPNQGENHGEILRNPWIWPNFGPILVWEIPHGTQLRFFFRPEVNSRSVRRASIGCAAPENWSEGRHSVCGPSALDGSMAKGLGWVVPQIYKHII